MLKKHYISLMNRVHHAIAPIALLALVSACGSSTSSYSMKEKFPTLSSMAKIEEHEFDYILDYQFDSVPGEETIPQDAESRYVIDVRGVKNLNIGARVDTKNSTYRPNPIFDLGLVNKDTLLDMKVQSTGDDSEKYELSMSSKKDATQESDQFSESFSASAKYRLVSSSVAQNYSRKSQNTTSSGQIGIIMTRYRTGAYVRLLVDNFHGENDFTAFLIGSALNDATMKPYVDFERSVIPGRTEQYISKLQINKKGQLSNKYNIYGNLQLLKKMEDGFSELKGTYVKFKDDTTVSKEVKDQMLTNLKTLRRYISLSIRDFYALHGDAFVSSVDLMNYGYGKGDLAFDNQSGITETQWGVAASASYQGLGVAGGGSQSVQQAKQSGWTTEIKNSKVSVSSFPTGVIDVKAWGDQIHDMLAAEKPISVPPLNLPTMADVKLPQPIGTAKDPSEPPDGCFKSYDEWKKYQNEKKGKNQPQQQVEQAEQQVNDIGIVEALDQGGLRNVVSRPVADLYVRYKKELRQLGALRAKRLSESKNMAAPLKDGSNIMRVEKMFVSGFDMTRYDGVLPHLRPDLTISGEADNPLDGFPNVAKLIYIADVLGDLDNYVRLMSNYSVSGVTKDMSSRFKTFYDEFVKDVYNMIDLQLLAGVDIPQELLISFGSNKFGTGGDLSRSALFSAFGGDLHAVNYVLYLQRPGAMKVWRSAPSGYMPVSWNASNGNLLFLNPISMGDPDRRFSYARRGEGSIDYGFSFHEQDYSSYSKNPVDFYDITKFSDPVQKSYKSPWYPVYKYRPGKDPNLIFQQFAGAYRVVIGPKYAVVASPNYMPFGESQWNQHYLNYRLNRTTPKFSMIISPDFGMTASKYYEEDDNTFSDSVDFDYALYFDNLPQPMRQKFVALTVGFRKDHGWPIDEIYQNGKRTYSYLVNPGVPLRGYVSSWQKDKPKKAIDGKFKVVDLKKVDKYKDSYFVLQLLPLNKLTTNGSNEKAFVYANNSKGADIINNDSFDGGYNMSILNY